MSVHSVRFFNGQLEVVAYPDRSAAEAYITDSGGWRNSEGKQELSIVTLDIPVRICVVCDEKAVTDPDVDFCRHCHLTGRAQARIRAVQIERFTKAFPDASFVGPEHTGGGCFRFTVRFGTDDPFYVLTDGEASLPEDDEGQAVPDGGWGYVGVYPAGAEDDDAIRCLHLEEEAVHDWMFGLTDEEAIDLIRNDRRDA